MESKEVKPRFKKGFWKPEEDLILKKYVETHGEGNWTLVSKKSGLLRGAKSCRLRWKNYLRPNIKRGMMSEDEKDLIIRLHKLLGNRWSLIAGRLPGRTDNEVKNYWNTHLNKRASRDQSENKRQLSSSSHTVPGENLETMTKEAETRDNNMVEEDLRINLDYDYSMNTMPPDHIHEYCYSPMFNMNYETLCAPMLDNLVLMEYPFGDQLLRETIFE